MSEDKLREESEANLRREETDHKDDVRDKQVSDKKQDEEIEIELKEAES